MTLYLRAKGGHAMTGRSSLKVCETPDGTESFLNPFESRIEGIRLVTCLLCLGREVVRTAEEGIMIVDGAIRTMRR